MLFLRLPIALGIAVFLVACGGGGGSASPTAPSATAFPLRAAIDAVTRDGETFTLTATGTAATEATDGRCSGSMRQTSSPANVSTSFRGQPVLASTHTSTATLDSICSSTSASSTQSTNYYDTRYTPVATVHGDGSYTVWDSTPTLPDTARVGDSGPIGTMTEYTSAGAVSGSSAYSYVIEADTASTALFNMVLRYYDTAGKLSLTSQTRRQLNPEGTAAPVVSWDIQSAESSGIHLVFRR
ncbi:MAG: hypothetical protein IPN06_14230 [Burkholderiales bacterium]|nr:hypothetical protein [Burkholderiales bacterium]